MHDGPAALEAAREFLPDVVLLDIALPGLSGYDVARSLRRQSALSRVTLVAMTGFGLEEDRLRTRECGFDHHMVKPIDLAVLRQLLKTPSQRQAVDALITARR